MMTDETWDAINDIAALKAALLAEINRRQSLERLVLQIDQRVNELWRETYPDTE